MPLRIGTSGWSYDHWHGVLYPHGIPPRERLGVYLTRYGTVELNSSYYRWPSDAAGCLLCSDESARGDHGRAGVYADSAVHTAR